MAWASPRDKGVADYVYRVEDLRTGKYDNIHSSRLNFYGDANLDAEAIMSHVLSAETGMPVARLLRLVRSRWRPLRRRALEGAVRI